MRIWTPPGLPVFVLISNLLARANEEIEKKLNSAVFPGAQGGPLMHVIAAKAVCFTRVGRIAARGYPPDGVPVRWRIALGRYSPYG